MRLHARKSERLLFAFIVGAIAGLIVGIAVHDWSMAAHAGEKGACKDRPDTVAYYVRKPGEGHGTESCQQIPRYGDPAWIPYMTHPLRGKE